MKFFYTVALCKYCFSLFCGRRALTGVLSIAVSQNVWKRGRLTYRENLYLNRGCYEASRGWSFVASKQGQAFCMPGKSRCPRMVLVPRNSRWRRRMRSFIASFWAGVRGIRDATARRQTALVADTDRPGYPEKYTKELIKQTGDKFLVPETK